MKRFWKINAHSKLTFYLMAILTFCEKTDCEVFTALADMEPLLETEKYISEFLNSYIKNKEDKIAYLRKKMEDYKNQYDKASVNIDGFLGNPLNAYKLIKKLTIDYDNLKTVIQGDFEEDSFFYKTIAKLNVPSYEDFSGASTALMRLQGTYKLHIPDLVRGIVLGTQASEPMTASECFEMGRICYNDGDYHHTNLWMIEAMRIFKEETEKTVSKVDILEYIAFTKYMLGDIKQALIHTNELLKLEPNHNRAKNNIPHYEEKLKNNKTKTDVVADVPKRVRDKKIQLYEALCRGDFRIDPYFKKKVSCRYDFGTQPFNKIAPFKVEELYHNPDIALIYGVMSDNEINMIQTMAKPRFKRAQVQHSETGEMVATNYRISKSGWLNDHDNPVVARISQRVTDMTGLSTESAEELQVVNYGIGGHYVPHFDFTRRENMLKSFMETEYGNRIATVLFYMTNVEQGGATVFLELGVVVQPVKGAALFWYNLHPSGEGNYDTRHAACPVLRGSKWVSNKWLHMRGQEFIKPCNLEYQPEGFPGTVGQFSKETHSKD